MKINSPLNVFASIVAVVVFNNNIYSQNITIESNDSIGGKPRNSIAIGGYIKLVAAYDYIGLPNGSSFNMIEIPTVGDVENRSINFNAWQSRIILKNTYITKKREQINAYLEGDFHGGDGGGFRLRHAYVNFKNWTIGHTNSVFVNNDVWVNISDFDGPPVGIWVRQPQIRYTFNVNESDQFNFSIEDPVVDFGRYDSIDSLLTPTKSYIPDFVANYRHQFKGGNFQLSGVARVLSYRENDIREKTYGYGGTFSGTFNVLKKDILFYQVLAGAGIERYLVGLGGYGLDAVPYNSELSALPVYGGYVGFQHFWNSNLNSSFMYGYQEVQNNIYTDYSNVFVGNYYSANLFFNPIENITLGFEFVYGDKTDYLDQKGRNHRFYFTMEYSF